MATFDPISGVTSQIWTVLNANTTWAGLVKDQVRYDQAEGSEDPENEFNDDAQYPRATLTLVSGSGGMYTKDATFATYAKDSSGNPLSPPDIVEQNSMVVLLELWSDLLNQTASNVLLVETLKAIRAAGARLGLPYVSSFKYRFQQRKTSEVDAGEGFRWYTQFFLYIDTEVDTQTLQGA